MNAYAQKVSSYTQNDVATANRLRLLVMLYDSAVKNMYQAVKRLDEGDLAGKGEHISKALAIVSEFRATLDFGAAPDLAGQLDRLYGFIADRLLDANIRNDKRPLGEALRITNMLRSAWVELSERTQGETPDSVLGDVARTSSPDNVVAIRV